MYNVYEDNYEDKSVKLWSCVAVHGLGVIICLHGITLKELNLRVANYVKSYT